MEWHEGNLYAAVVLVESPEVVLDESLPVVLVESPPVDVATLLPGVSQGVSMIRSKRMAISFRNTIRVKPMKQTRQDFLLPCKRQ